MDKTPTVFRCVVQGWRGYRCPSPAVVGCSKGPLLCTHPGMQCILDTLSFLFRSILPLPRPNSYAHKGGGIWYHLCTNFRLHHDPYEACKHHMYCKPPCRSLHRHTSSSTSSKPTHHMSRSRSEMDERHSATATTATRSSTNNTVHVIVTHGGRWRCGHLSDKAPVSRGTLKSTRTS